VVSTTTGFEEGKLGATHDDRPADPLEDAVQKHLGATRRCCGS